MPMLPLENNFGTTIEVGDSDKMSQGSLTTTEIIPQIIEQSTIKLDTIPINTKRPITMNTTITEGISNNGLTTEKISITTVSPASLTTYPDNIHTSTTIISIPDGLSTMEYENMSISDTTTIETPTTPSLEGIDYKLGKSVYVYIIKTYNIII